MSAIWETITDLDTKNISIPLFVSTFKKNIAWRQFEELLNSSDSPARRYWPFPITVKNVPFIVIDYGPFYSIMWRYWALKGFDRISYICMTIPGCICDQVLSGYRLILTQTWKYHTLQRSYASNMELAYLDANQ